MNRYLEKIAVMYEVKGHSDDSILHSLGYKKSGGKVLLNDREYHEYAKEVNKDDNKNWAKRYATGVGVGAAVGTGVGAVLQKKMKLPTSGRLKVLGSSAVIGGLLGSVAGNSYSTNTSHNRGLEKVEAIRAKHFFPHWYPKDKKHK